eukprot:2252815-Amphidinium_carterae.1
MTFGKAAHRPHEKAKWLTSCATSFPTFAPRATYKDKRPNPLQERPEPLQWLFIVRCLLLVAQCKLLPSPNPHIFGVSGSAKLGRYKTSL